MMAEYLETYLGVLQQRLTDLGWHSEITVSPTQTDFHGTISCGDRAFYLSGDIRDDDGKDRFVYALLSDDAQYRFSAHGRLDQMLDSVEKMGKRLT